MSPTESRGHTLSGSHFIGLALLRVRTFLGADFSESTPSKWQIFHFLSPAEGKLVDFLRKLQSGGCEFLPEFLSEFLSKEFQSDSAFQIISTEIRALIRPVIRLEIRV